MCVMYVLNARKRVGTETSEDPNLNRRSPLFDGVREEKGTAAFPQGWGRRWSSSRWCPTSKSLCSALGAARMVANGLCGHQCHDMGQYGICKRNGAFPMPRLSS
jgi:hypothetical protein